MHGSVNIFDLGLNLQSKNKFSFEAGRNFTAEKNKVKQNFLILFADAKFLENHVQKVLRIDLTDKLLERIKPTF